MDELETLALTPTEPIILTYRVYLSDDTTVVQNDPPITLDIQTVTATQNAISFNAGMTNLSKAARAALANEFSLDAPEVDAIQRADVPAPNARPSTPPCSARPPI